MASLAGRELKFLFTSPIFISLELVPVVLITIMGLTGNLTLIIPNDLLPIVWMMIVFYSTYFELELWRKGFLNKGVKLKAYASGSPYALFLEHSAVSLVLLELKTLIIIPSFLSSTDIGFLEIIVFLIATHINWLFSISVGSIFSKEVFNNMKDSVDVFLCILIFNAIVVLIANSKYQSSYSLNGLWPTPSLENGGAESFLRLPFLTVSLIILMLFIVAVYVNSMVVKGLRMDGS
ncbi:MAG: hypothetical protein QW304_05770 [Thermoproteota archaeon]